MYFRNRFVHDAAAYLRKREKKRKKEKLMPQYVYIKLDCKMKVTTP